MVKIEDEEIPIGKYIFIAILVIGFLTFLFGGFYIINAGQRGVIVTLGNPSDEIITEGLHIKIPIVQSIVKFDIKTQKVEIKTSSASKDLQIVFDEIAVNYHLEANSAPRIFREVGKDYVNRILAPAILEATKAATAQYTAEELITKREAVKETMKVLLMERMTERGIVIEDVLITDFDYSETFNTAIEAKVTAEQNALAAKNKLMQIEYEAQQRVTQATGEAEAIKIQAQAIQSQGGKEYVQLQAIAKWNGIMPTVTGGAMPFINLAVNSTN